MKITEPKTPFIHYNHSTDEIYVPPMDLAGALDNVDRSEIEDRPNEQDWEDDDDAEKDQVDTEKHKKFQQSRLAHYNMKESTTYNLGSFEKR